MYMTEIPDERFESIPQDQIDQIVATAQEAYAHTRQDQQGNINFRRTVIDGKENLAIRFGTTEAGTTYVLAIKVHEQYAFGESKLIVTKYTLDTQSGDFNAWREQHDSISTLVNKGENVQDAREVDNLLFHLGMHRPDPNDWDDFTEIVEAVRNNARDTQSLSDIALYRYHIGIQNPDTEGDAIH